MEVGNVLLATGIACSAASALLSVPAVSRLIPKGRDLARPLVMVSFLAITGAFARLVIASLSSDFGLEYVWEHSSVDLDPIYRLSAVWAGGSGSLLLCTWLISVVLALEVFAGGAARETGRPFKSAFASTMSLLVAFFSFTVLVSGMFDSTRATALVAHPEGLGMDILLQTPEMVVHAPLIFGAYAALCAVFAASVSHHLTGERLWHRVGLPWGRLAWLLLTAGIGIGAYWAYYVIGWGGYWSWDPVETASLVPWFMATAFLHAQHRNLRKEEYSVASPMFGMLSLVGVVFVSFVVRAGGLWNFSVHDYGVSSSSSAVVRIVSLLQDDLPLAGTLAFMVALLAVASYLSVRAMRAAGPAPSAPAPKRLSEYVSDQNNMAVAITLFALAALAAVTLMFKNIDNDQEVLAGEIGQKMTLIFVALAVAMCLCLTWRLVGRGRALIATLALVIASMTLGLVGSLTGAVNGVVAFALPSCGAALLASLVRLAQSLARGSAKSRVFRAGAQVVHVGIALVLTAYVVSSNLQSYPQGGDWVALHVDGQVSVGDYVIVLVGLEMSDDVSGYPAEVVRVATASVDVFKDGDMVADDARMKVLYGRDTHAGYYELESLPFVESKVSEDLYVSFHWWTEDVAWVHAKVVPMMTALWAGLALVIAGAAVRMWTFEPSMAPRDRPG